VLPFNLRDVRPVIRGVLFKDDNANCALDAPELRLNHWQIALAGNNRTYYTQSFQDGSFRIVADTGTYTISVRLPNNAWRVCPGNYTLTAGSSDTIDIFIPVEAFEQCPELQVNLGIGNPNLRRCFNNRYLVSYCNGGTTPATDVEVLLQVDPWIEVDSFSVPYEALGGGAYRITAGGIETGDCGTFFMYVTPDCDAPLGLLQCVQGRVEPVDICSAFASQWSGPTITTNGYCTGDEASFTLRNIGGQAQTDSLEYRIFQNGVLVETGRYILDAGDSLMIIRPSDNDSWRFETDQAGGHPCSVLPSVSIDGCGQGGPGQVGVSYALQFPNDPGCPFEDRECYLIVGSYDPNDKTAFPAGYGPDHLIEPGTDIEYLIRFQNVGNDTAFHVFVRDTLSPFLDPATVEVTGYSHPYQLRIRENGALEFAFYHIHLTDTIRDEPGSHGYIKFRVAQTAGNALGTIIHNQAAIYFDFNAPIFTNTVFHTLGVNFVPDAIAPLWEVPPSDLLLDCHRNGEVDAVIQQWLDDAGGAQVFDHSGEVSFSYDFNSLSNDCNGLGGSAEVTFTATDKWGNQSTRTAQLVAIDTIAPAWVQNPVPFVFQCGDENAWDNLDAWLAQAGGALAEDNCDTAHLESVFTGSITCTQSDTLIATFIVQDGCGNANTATAPVYVVLPSAASGKATAHSNIRVFPNPARTTVWIQWEDASQPAFRLRLFDASGSLLAEVKGLGNTVELPVGQYGSGMYFLTVDTEAGRYGWGRFVVQ